MRKKKKKPHFNLHTPPKPLPPPRTSEEQTCTACLSSLPLYAFPISLTGTNGRGTICKICLNKGSKETRSAKMARRNEYRLQ